MKKTLSVFLSLALCYPIITTGAPQKGTTTHSYATQQNESDSEYQFRIGAGHSREGRYDLAETWLLKSAQQNNSKAQELLALNYYYGKKGTVDYKRAIYWLTKAASNGSMSANFMLGTVYIAGEGTPKDVDYGLYLIGIAKKNGFLPATEYLEVFDKLKEHCRNGDSKACNITKTPPVTW